MAGQKKSPEDITLVEIEWKSGQSRTYNRKIFLKE